MFAGSPRRGAHVKVFESLQERAHAFKGYEGEGNGYRLPRFGIPLGSQILSV